MFDSIIPNRLKEDDESQIVENNSLEDGVAALEITQAEGRSNQGIIFHGLLEEFVLTFFKYNYNQCRQMNIINR